MERTNSRVLRKPNWTAKENEMPDRARVRACTDKAKATNISIDQCEDEGTLFIGLTCADSSIEYTDGDIAMQIRIEDAPVLIEAMQQAYEKQVIKQHKRKWSNHND